MAAFYPGQSARALLRKHAAVLLALVLLVCGIAEAAHTHHDDDHLLRGVATQCSLCLAVHSPAQTASINPAPTLAVCFLIGPTCEPQLLSRLSLPSIFIRPPPAA